MTTSVLCTDEDFRIVVDTYHRAAQEVSEAAVNRLATMLAEFHPTAYTLDLFGTWDEDGELRIDATRILTASGEVLADSDDPTEAFDAFCDATFDVRMYLASVTGVDYVAESRLNVAGNVEFRHESKETP